MKDPSTVYSKWTIEEIVSMLNDLTLLGLTKPSERLDEHLSARLL